MRLIIATITGLAATAALAQSPPSAVVRQQVRLQDFNYCVATARRLLEGGVSHQPKFSLREDTKGRFVVASGTDVFVCDGRDPMHNGKRKVSVQP